MPNGNEHAVQRDSLLLLSLDVFHSNAVDVLSIAQNLLHDTVSQYLNFGVHKEEPFVHIRVR